MAMQKLLMTTRLAHLGSLAPGRQPGPVDGLMELDGRLVVAGQTGHGHFRPGPLLNSCCRPRTWHGSAVIHRSAGSGLFVHRSRRVTTQTSSMARDNARAARPGPASDFRPSLPDILRGPLDPSFNLSSRITFRAENGMGRPGARAGPASPLGRGGYYIVFVGYIFRGGRAVPVTF